MYIQTCLGTIIDFAVHMHAQGKEYAKTNYGSDHLKYLNNRLLKFIITFISNNNLSSGKKYGNLSYSTKNIQ